MNRINEELSKLEQKWNTWEIPKHVPTQLLDYVECTDLHKMKEDKKRYCKEEKYRIARDLFREKARIEDKITTCLNKKTGLAIKFGYNNFSNQASWNIVKCKDCTFYDPRGVCTGLGIWNPKSPRICKHFFYLTDEDIKLRRMYGDEEIE